MGEQEIKFENMGTYQKFSMICAAHQIQQLIPKIPILNFHEFLANQPDNYIIEVDIPCAD